MKPQIILCFLIFAALIVVIGTSSFSITQDHSKEDLGERTSTTAASLIRKFSFPKKANPVFKSCSLIKKKGSKPDIKIASQFRTQIRRRSIQQDQSKGATGTLSFSTNQDHFKEEQLKKEYKSTTPTSLMEKFVKVVSSSVCKPFSLIKTVVFKTNKKIANQFGACFCRVQPKKSRSSRSIRKKSNFLVPRSFTSRLVADSFLHVFMTIMVVNMKFNLSLICT